LFVPFSFSGFRAPEARSRNERDRFSLTSPTSLTTRTEMIEEFPSPRSLDLRPRSFDLDPSTSILIAPTLAAAPLWAERKSISPGKLGGVTSALRRLSSGANTMLTPQQERLVRLAELRSQDVEQFNAHVTDATAGRREISSAELRSIVDEALRIARLPYRNKRWAKVQ
jgi:hypothetical protein